MRGTFLRGGDAVGGIQLLRGDAVVVLGLRIRARQLVHTGMKAVSISRPSGSWLPGLRTMTPPGGVLVAAEMPYFFMAAELSTAPCIETWPTTTGLSGKSLSRS